jgi:hypothetical protein
MSTASASLIKYDFSYQFSDTRILAGSFLGTLLSDNDTIEVMQVLDFVSLDGTDMTSLSNVGAYSSFGSGAPGLLSISGTILDLYATDPNGTNGFVVSYWDPQGGTQTVAQIIASDGTTADESNEQFSSLNWSLRASPVSAPSTLAIFALGMIGLASRRFKKQS